MTIEMKSRLKQLIQERCIKVLDRSITLSSGETTYYYYDIKGLFNGEGLNLVGELLLTEVLKFNPKSVGGLEVGAIPLISVIVALGYASYTNRSRFASIWSFIYLNPVPNFDLQTVTNYFSYSARLNYSSKAMLLGSDVWYVIAYILTSFNFLYIHLSSRKSSN